MLGLGHRLFHASASAKGVRTPGRSAFKKLFNDAQQLPPPRFSQTTQRRSTNKPDAHTTTLSLVQRAPSGHGPRTLIPGFERHSSALSDQDIQRVFTLGAECAPDRAWALARALVRYDRRLALSSALTQHGMTLVDFQVRWAKVACAPDADGALTALNDLDLGLGADPIPNPRSGSTNTGTAVPAWLLLHIVAHLVKTPAQAASVCTLLLQQLPGLPSALAPWALILAAHALARTDCQSAARRLMAAFLTLPAPTTRAVHFDLLLQTLARFPSSPEATGVVFAALAGASARGVALHPRTYLALLDVRFVTLSLARTLEARMENEAFAPRWQLYARLVKVYAVNGLSGDAGRCLERVRALKNIAGQLPPLAPYEQIAHDRKGQLERINTQYLSAFRADSKVSSTYVSQLAALAPVPPAGEMTKEELTPNGVNGESAASQAVKHDAILDHLVSSADDHIHEPPAPSPSPSASSPSPLKSGINMHDWTTVLASAARAKTTSAPALLALFKRTPPQFFSTPHTPGRAPPATVACTVVMRGLLSRGEATMAREVWDALRQGGAELDKRALSVGVQVLVATDKVEEAFMLLEEHRTPRRDEARVGRGARHGVRQEEVVNISVINALMSALIWQRRPDLVLRLWDDLHLLYGLQPDGGTLHVMLSAARLWGVMGTESFRGALGFGFNFHFPFRSSSPAAARGSAPQTREEALHEMLTGVPGVPGRWKGAHAWKEARRVFRQVVLGNFPELLRVAPPVSAARASRDDSAFRPFHELTGWGSGAGTSGDEDDFVAREGEVMGIQELARQGLYPGAYPQLVPENRHFLAYIHLMACAPASRAWEIPMVLAWMRALGLRPKRATLGVALAYWAEVSLGAPWMERAPGGSGSGRYAALIRWVRDWVGNEDMLTERELGDWVRVVEGMRGRSAKSRYDI